MDEPVKLEVLRQNGHRGVLNTAPTISLCMIVRDLDSPGLRACLESVKGWVDEVILTVASDKEPSIDDIQDFLDRFPDDEAHVDVRYFEWCDDFAAARNDNFRDATGDWILWLDDDDIVEGAENLRRICAEAERSGIGCLHLEYKYRHNERGQVTVTQNRERLMRRSLGWSWRDRVHETANAEREHAVGFSSDVVIRHTTNKANTERNLRLLQLMEEETPEYPRMLAALGDTYQSQGDFKTAIRYLMRFYERAEISLLQWSAAAEIARCFQGLKRWNESIQWAMTAAIVHPEYSLPYLLMAHASWFGKHDAERALRYIDDADSREEAPLTTHRQPEDYTLRRWDIEHRCYGDLGEWDKALKICLMGMQYQGFNDLHVEKVGPGREGLAHWQSCAWYYFERQKMEQSVEGVVHLVDHLFRRGDTLRARRLLEQDLPLSIREDKRILALYERVRRLTAHVVEDPVEGYQAFYEENHSGLDDPDHIMNGTDIEPYRMNVLLKRLQARGAKRVLDVGCGAGEPAMFLADHGIHVLGLDINGNAIREAQKRADERFGSLAQDGVKALYKPAFRVGTLDTLGPEDLGRFDAVIIMEVIEHLPTAKVPFYFGAAEDFLDPGGAVFMTCPGMAIGDIPGVYDEFPRDHVTEFSRQDLEKLILQSPSRRLKRPINLHKIYDPAVSVPGFASWFIEYEWDSEDATPAEEWGQPVAIYVGPGLEDWNAEMPEKYGLGGSETWAIETARELRRRGHPVVVYAMVDEVRDGVIYRHHSRFDSQRPFAGSKAWMHIISRDLSQLDVRPNAEHVLFVAHDVDYGEALTEDRLENMDAYCVMSEWQRNHTIAKYHFDYESWVEDVNENPALPAPPNMAEKIRIIANGIVPEYFEGEAPERPQHSFIWSSSPDRGLHVLLSWWPAIREMWPDATLDVFYGWENVDALSSTRPWLRDFKDQVVQMADQDGVTWRGRIGQRDLAWQMRKHWFWLYPSVDAFGGVWHETYCITALEAQAGGCIPVMPAAGALPERLYAGYMAEGEVLQIAEALEALQAWDARFVDVTPVYENTWQAATDKLLDAVREPVQA